MPLAPIIAAVVIVVALIAIGLLLRYGSVPRFMQSRDTDDRVPLLGGKARTPSSGTRAVGGGG